MSDKYTINNCELICNGECPNSKTGYCQDCTDCLLKQIANECTNSLRFSCERILAEKLLGLLDIQECEND